MGYALTTSTTVRQTVLSGKVNSNGYADFLSAGTGLAVNLEAATEPVIVTFAQGFNELGTVDYFEKIDADQVVSELPASVTSFIYVDRDLATSAVTSSHTTLQPEYGYKRPESPAEGQHFFSIPKMVMEVYNGTDWEIKQRVFLGEATTDASSVSDVVTYALRGEYISDWITVTTGNTYTFNHNMGLELIDPMLYEKYSGSVSCRTNFWWDGSKYRGSKISSIQSNSFSTYAGYAYDFASATSLNLKAIVKRAF